MEVLYLILGTPTEGVKKKIGDKVSSLSDMSVRVTVVIAGHEDKASSESAWQYIAVPVLTSRISRLPVLWRLAVVAEQIAMYRSVSSYLASHLRYDIVLMRYPIADYFLYRFMKRFSPACRIVFEHNTLEEEELRLRASTSFWYRYFYYGERLFGRLVRLKAAGMICVTGEIASRQSNVVDQKVPVQVISNGINVSRIRRRNAERKYDGSVLNIIFLAGSDSPWHGIDILFNSLERYVGTVPIHCYVAGSVGQEISSRARALHCVTVLPHLSIDGLDSVMDICHVGVGSLGLFRNMMREACTLKVREYWSRGIPFIVGYDDTDLLNNSSMTDYYLKVEFDHESASPAFNVEKLVEFADRVYQNRDLHERMRMLAEQYIGYPAKAKAYVDFFKKLLS